MFVERNSVRPVHSVVTTNKLLSGLVSLPLSARSRERGGTGVLCPFFLVSYVVF